MTEPRTTGEAIQVVRRVLYDLARRPDWPADGALQLDIVNYALARKWPVPIRGFEAIVAHHIRVGTVEFNDANGAGLSTIRYRLTALGDLEEEDHRRSLKLKVVDELRRPPRIVDLVYLIAGIAITLAVQLVLAALGIGK